MIKQAGASETGGSFSHRCTKPNHKSGAKKPSCSELGMNWERTRDRDHHVEPPKPGGPAARTADPGAPRARAGDGGEAVRAATPCPARLRLPRCQNRVYLNTNKRNSEHKASFLFQNRNKLSPPSFGSPSPSLQKAQSARRQRRQAGRRAPRGFQAAGGCSGGSRGQQERGEDQDFRVGSQAPAPKPSQQQEQ